MIGVGIVLGACLIMTAIIYGIILRMAPIIVFGRREDNRRGNSGNRKEAL